MRKTILCFGDSNTWGRSPFGVERHPEHHRWPNVMAADLGEGAHVLAEGLNGRTTVWDDPIEEHRNGKRYLSPCLLSHMPIDLVVLMLGTNDMKKRFSVSPFDIGRSIGLLLDTILASGAGPDDGAPAVLLMSPPPIAKLGEFAEMFEGSEEKSLKLPHYYALHAEQRGCRFFDAGSVARSSDADGLHLEGAEHVKLGRAVAEQARAIIGLA